MESLSPRRIGLTTWVVLGLCTAVGVIAVAMTAIVIVRLNRQVLASAAELRATLGNPSAATATFEPTKLELLEYAAQVTAIEATWAQTTADYRLRYPGSPIYESVATAQAIAQVNALKRPPAVAELHERWAQAWSDRDAALALLGKQGLTDDDRSRATELGRRASDTLRRVRNDLHDLMVARGIGESEIAAIKPAVP